MFEIKKLTIDLLDDWLAYFDNVAFADNDEWVGCYCMCYHWNETLASQQQWDCSKTGAAYNRERAIEFIKQGHMQGYLAYRDGTVVGWCNANDKQAYHSVHMDFSSKDKVKSIVCFCISPNFRGKGIASKLLDRVCADAAEDGYEYIEAYPFVKDEYTYHGTKSMYEKNGFIDCGNIKRCTVVRKCL